MQPTHPLQKILLPYDGSPSARLALQFAATMVRANPAANTLLTLLYVSSGGYLARHLQNVDLRTVRLEATEEWRRIRQYRIDREIKPLLAEGQQLLAQSGIQTPLAVQIEEGKIGEQILAVAQHDGYSAIIMGRRGLSPLKELMLGSTTQYVLTHAQAVNVFVVGRGYGEASPPPPFPLLLPVDGSEPSLLAVRQAAQLIKDWPEEQRAIVLLHVVDLALLGQTLSGEAQILIAEGSKALAAAREILGQTGIHTGVEEKMLSGIPAQVIAQEARERRCPLVIMGSAGHSFLSRLILGSITHSVLHLASQPTIGVIYPPTG